MSRILPNSDRAERLLLGACINKTSHVAALRARLHSELFYSGTNRAMFECLASAHDVDAEFDMPQILDARDHHPHALMLNTSYMLEVINAAAVWSLQHVEAVLVSLEDYYMRRELIRVADTASACAYTLSEPVPAALAELTNETSKLAARLQAGSTNSMREAVINALTWAKAGAMDAAVPMQWPTLRRDFQGLRSGGLTVLAARPGTGKSALAVQLAVAAAQAGKGVLFCSLEMPEGEVALRMVAHVSGVPMNAIGSALPVREVKALQSLEIRIDDRASIGMADVRVAALKFKADLATRDIPLGLVIVDHMHIMRHGPGRNPVSELNETTMGMKALAKELALPVLALAQLNRNSESRPSECPQLSDLRASGGIEQDADVVMFLHKPAAEIEPTTVQLTVAKNRQGRAPAHVFLEFSGATSFFREHGNQEPRAAKTTQKHNERNGLRVIGGTHNGY